MPLKLNENLLCDNSVLRSFNPWDHTNKLVLILLYLTESKIPPEINLCGSIRTLLHSSAWLSLICFPSPDCLSCFQFQWHLQQFPGYKDMATWAQCSRQTRKWIGLLLCKHLASVWAPWCPLRCGHPGFQHTSPIPPDLCRLSRPQGRGQITYTRSGEN